MADVTLFPPTSILSNHSHQVYHHPTSPVMSFSELGIDFRSRIGPTLGIGFGPGTGQFGIPTSQPLIGHSRTTTTAYPGSAPCLRSPFQPSLPRLRRYTMSYTPRPPQNGACPLLDLPDELILSIFAHLPLEDLLCLRRTSKRFTPLALHPSLHRTLTLVALPPSPLPALLTQYILPNLHHLHLHLFPLPSSSVSNKTQPASLIHDLLSLVPADQLRSLSLPFSAPYLPAKELGDLMHRIGGKLETLDLRGAAVSGSMYLEWMEGIGKQGKGLEELDLGFTAISVLPGALTSEDDIQGVGLQLDRAIQPWASLRKLSLASCASLSSDTLATFLADLPENIESLDLSRLEQTTFDGLKGMSVTHNTGSTRLKEIKLVGIDHLTRSNIRTLKNHWETQRRSTLPASPIIPFNPVSEKRVWGEPHTPLTPLPISSLPRRIPASRPITESDSWSISPSTPDLCSRSSSATSSEGSLESSFPHPRATVLSSHSALWTALSQDAKRDIQASPGVWESKLPENPYLPSRSHRYINPKPNISSHTYTWNHPALSRPSRNSTDEKDVLVGIHITHSAILESEDEEGYRMFIGQVAGAGTVPLGLGLGVEVDQGIEMGSGGGVGSEMGVSGGGLGGWGGDGRLGWDSEGEEYLAGQVGV